MSRWRIIARRPHGSFGHWYPETPEAVKDARRAYDAGRCEIATRMVPGGFELLRIERRIPTPKRHWFRSAP